MRPHYSTTIPAVFDPITLDQAVAHVRVDSEDDIASLTAYSAVAREYVDSVTGRVSAVTSFMVVADSWIALTGSCHSDTIPIFRVPLVSVESVSYYAPDAATLTVMPPEDYRVITTTEPGMVQIIGDMPAFDSRPDAIQIEFTAGYSSPALAPAMLSHAVMSLTVHFHENRAPIVFSSHRELPFHLTNLIENQKIGGWCA